MSTTAPDLATAVDWAKRGQQSMVKCLAHEDGTASVHVSPGTEQPVTIRCHANCDTQDVLAASGLDWAEVCKPLEQSMWTGEEWTPAGPASHVYSYHDDQGNILFQALRIPQANGSKRFMQRHQQGDGRWAWNLEGVPRVLYRLPSILAAKERGHDIWFFEGEKDVETAVMDGLHATCNPMGAGKWMPEYSETLRGCRVRIVADNDNPGREHARAVAEALVAVDCEVIVYETMMEGCKDYSDHRARGGTTDTLTVTWQSEVKRNTRPEYGIRDFIRTEFEMGREIIPGHFAQANIALVVGPEGFGKSLFLRQIAVQCAAGINPFTSADMEPLRVLYIDGENPEHQQKLDWSKLDYLARRHKDGDDVANENLRIIAAWEDAPSIISTPGQSWLMERITAIQPDLCIIGPLSDVVEGSLSDDDVARKVKRSLYKARAICGTGFMIEHHSPHRMQGDKTREMRPYGSSVFRRFPDFGYGLQPTDTEGEFGLVPFRGARVRSRAWPTRMRWGVAQSMEWPWEFVPDVAGSVTVGNFGAGA